MFYLDNLYRPPSYILDEELSDYANAKLGDAWARRRLSSSGANIRANRLLGQFNNSDQNIVDTIKPSIRKGKERTFAALPKISANYQARLEALKKSKNKYERFQDIIDDHYDSKDPKTQARLDRLMGKLDDKISRKNKEATRLITKKSHIDGIRNHLYDFSNVNSARIKNAETFLSKYGIRHNIGTENVSDPKPFRLSSSGELKRNDIGADIRSSIHQHRGEKAMETITKLGDRWDKQGKYQKGAKDEKFKLPSHLVLKTDKKEFVPFIRSQGMEFKNPEHGVWMTRSQIKRRQALHNAMQNGTLSRFKGLTSRLFRRK